MNTIYFVDIIFPSFIKKYSPIYSMRKKYHLKKSRPFLYKSQSQTLHPSIFVTKKESQKVREEIWYKIRRNIRKAESRLLYMLIKPYKIPRAKHQDFRKGKGRKRNQKGSYFFLEGLKPRIFSFPLSERIIKSLSSEYNEEERKKRAYSPLSLCEYRSQSRQEHQRTRVLNDVQRVSLLTGRISTRSLSERPIEDEVRGKREKRSNLQEKDYNYHPSESLYRLEGLPLFSQKGSLTRQGQGEEPGREQIGMKRDGIREYRGQVFVHSQRLSYLLFGSTHRQRKKKRVFKIPMRRHWGGVARMRGFLPLIRERLGGLANMADTQPVFPLGRGRGVPLPCKVGSRASSGHWFREKEGRKVGSKGMYLQSLYQRGRIKKREGKKRPPFWDKISFSAQNFSKSPDQEFIDPVNIRWKNIVNPSDIACLSSPYTQVDKISTLEIKDSLCHEDQGRHQVNKIKRRINRTVHSLLYSYRGVLGRVGRKGGKRLSSFSNLLQEKRKWYQLYLSLDLPEMRREGRQAHSMRATSSSSPFVSLLESRLDVFFSRFCPWFSLNQIREDIQKGRILVNNQVQSQPNLQLEPGDLVSISNKNGELDAFRKRGLEFFEGLFKRKPIQRLRAGEPNRLTFNRIKVFSQSEYQQTLSLSGKGCVHETFRPLLSKEPVQTGRPSRRYPSRVKEGLSSRFQFPFRFEGRFLRREMRVFREGGPFLAKGSWAYRKKRDEGRKYPIPFQSKGRSQSWKERKGGKRFPRRDTRGPWAYKWWRQRTSRSSSDSRGVNLYRLLFLKVRKGSVYPSLPLLSR